MKPTLPPFTLITPWREQPSRVPAFEIMQKYYRKHLGVEAIPCDTDSDKFNIAAARNVGVEQAPTDIIVITDADTVPQPRSLFDAIRQVNAGDVAHMPFTHYRSIFDPKYNDWLIKRPVYDLPPGWDVDGHVSGVIVTTKRSWELHGGQDERFVGWGFEDNAWAFAHETLIGPFVRHPGYAFAMPHIRPTLDVNYYRNGGLVHRYEQAAGDKEAMMSIVFDERGLPRPKGLTQ